MIQITPRYQGKHLILLFVLLDIDGRVCDENIIHNTQFQESVF